MGYRLNAMIPNVPDYERSLEICKYNLKVATSLSDLFSENNNVLIHYDDLPEFLSALEQLDDIYNIDKLKILVEFATLNKLYVFFDVY